MEYKLTALKVTSYTQSSYVHIHYKVLLFY
jgi:hypothetical protein